MGRYVPPAALDAGLSANQASGKGHSLGARASKLKSGGGLVVRFEMPFPVWCTNCKPEQIIGQGVRFNAEKKKVGMYYTTPVWRFVLKHTVCGGRIEVETNPKEAEYVVVSGGRRRDEGRAKLLDGEMEVVGKVTEEERERLERDGGFGVVEKIVEDKREFESGKRRVEELVRASEREWGDPYEVNRRLRTEFRVGRRKRQKDKRTGEVLQERYGIGMELMEPREEDGLRAGLVDYGEHREVNASDKPLFDITDAGSKTTIEKQRGKRRVKMTAAEMLAQKKGNLQTQLRTNTRAGTDPFLQNTKTWQSELKRKRPDDISNARMSARPSTTGLVDYDSDEH